MLSCRVGTVSFDSTAPKRPFPKRQKKIRSLRRRRSSELAHIYEPPTPALDSVLYFRETRQKYFSPCRFAVRCLKVFLALPLVCLGIHVNATNSHFRARRSLVETGGREHKTRAAAVLAGGATATNTHYHDRDAPRGGDHLPDERCAACKSCFHKGKGFTKGELGKNSKLCQ